jgi:hypothetical protein
MIRIDLGFKVDVKITAPSAIRTPSSSEKPIHL